MKLQRIVSLANESSRLRFLAMVRSLRATGNNLPVWVIPYNENKFELPDGCVWWEIPEIINWVNDCGLCPAFKKIQCLTIENYQFVDSDVIFLKDPSTVLQQFSGFITSCTHWNNPAETITAETLVFFKNRSTTWPKLVFNSGQWGCDKRLFEEKELISFCENNYVDTLYKKNYIYKDQAGINLLVNYKNVPITNLTLPPINMESTWAGDYTDSYQKYWTDNDKMPYLIHWAGCNMNYPRVIDDLYFKYLYTDEIAMWNLQLRQETKRQNTVYKKVYRNLRYIKQVLMSLKFV